MNLRTDYSAAYREVVDTARGLRSADAYIINGTVINVYTGELIKSNVAVCGKYIAYVGESDRSLGQDTEVIDASGRFLCPGYIEPHGHPFLMYNPVSLSDKILPLGTTMMVADNLFFFRALGPEGFETVIEDLKKLPLKLFWSVRLDAQASSARLDAVFSPENISRLVNNRSVLQVGEITDWPSLLNGKPGMVEGILAALKTGKKAEGHAPGASQDTLNTLAAAGITACHESISGEEVLRRLRLGMYANLRHSSLRPDLPRLIKALLAAGVPLNRAMLTTDGPSPAYLAKGFTDYVLRTAMEAGLNPVTAYQMATLNAATYYGLDNLVGGIAPGCHADILLLEELDNPTPVLVMADGKVFADKTLNGCPGKSDFSKTDGFTVNWEKYGLGPIPRQTVSPDFFSIQATGRPFPVMYLENPVITRRRDKELPVRHGLLDIGGIPGLQYAALLDYGCSWVCGGVLSGFADHIGGLASSVSIAGNLVVIGSSREDMSMAANRLYELGGGIVIYEAGACIFELPLPLNGSITAEPVDCLVRKCLLFAEILKKKGHRFHDPVYTVLFLSTAHLPELRLSPEGLWEVKTKKVLLPIQKLK
ncbi:Adenine deaminase [Desulfofarcimen acetoxidans DSM 771]|uniref:adenine deaminase n=1 Tax=Desulfofarcimen acetoxidans (strain ATCC 49208 / DSM 771 / KCTC 5769 / VKM B-1644 / 5575) TaxID=485916 RepID=C8W395_DESAS|nr:adenine deaminase C-terminal domain-containing protein [Desulfofarcimen acetoxidans]ACV61862.1 Adenine deaminase [Desulfofarcimen acetoxidans DSM 771]